MHLWKCDCDFAFMCEAGSAPSCLVSASPSGASRGSSGSFLSSRLGPLGYLVHSALVSITTGTIPRQDPEQRGALRFSQMSPELTVPGEGVPWR